jgi:hypothetical protein
MIYSADSVKCVCQYGMKIDSEDCREYADIPLEETEKCQGGHNVLVYHKDHFDCRLDLLPVIHNCDEYSEMRLFESFGHNRFIIDC